MTLKEAAKYVRSKNAGPFWMTIDIFCGARDAYEKLKQSRALCAASISEIYHIDSGKIKRFDVDDLNVIKISLPRPCPQGSRHERDMHSGQQYVPLLDVEV
jgi:hypothetical protein